MSSWESISQLARAAPALNDQEFGSFLSNTNSITNSSNRRNDSPSSFATSTADSRSHHLNRSRSHRHSSEFPVLTEYQKSLQQKAPQIPDLRFEKSYRKSIAHANGSWWRVALITIRDQLSFPLIQGFLWNLLLVGVKTWRLTAATSGNNWGSKYFVARRVISNRSTLINSRL